MGATECEEERTTPEAQRMKKFLAYGLILFTGGLVIYAFLPYLNGLFGAFLLFALFRPLYMWLRHQGIWASVSALLVILVTILIVVLPIALLAPQLVTEISRAVDSAPELASAVEDLQSIFPGVDVEAFITAELQELGSNIRRGLLTSLNDIVNAAVTIFIMYALLFYMLVDMHRLRRFAFCLIPFSQKNSRRLFKEFKKVTNATIIATGLIALMQGGLLALGFYIFGVPNVILFGIVGVILSFLPVVGVPILWIPAAAFKLIQGHTPAAVGLLVWGLVISNMDNFLRPWLQRKVGSIHPLTTLIGVFIGIPLFGIIGLLMGPLLLSYSYLLLEMVEEEYLAS